MLENLTDNDQINLVSLIILIAVFASSMIARAANRPIKFLQDASIWLGVIFVLVIGYSYRYEFSGLKNRLMGELSPSSAIEGTDGEISFRMSRDGHYYIMTKVNGEPVEFMLDTGASDVVITRKIAKQIGINPKDLEFTKIYNTANGTVRGAPILIETIEIGGRRIQNVRASVNDSDLTSPLLGMSFLDKLQGYEVRDGVLKLWF
jgi:aspartyl protease family protein